LKKNIQLVLEKNPSGVMGRDLRRLYKETTGKELPLQDFSVQRPIELVEKELSDTVYYTRESDGDVKYFLRKKVPEAGHRPLWQLTSHGDDHCNTVVPGDVSFEELKLQVIADPRRALSQVGPPLQTPFPLLIFVLSVRRSCRLLAFLFQTSTTVPRA
jgi:hypothetical protein